MRLEGEMLTSKKWFLFIAATGAIILAAACSRNSGPDPADANLAPAESSAPADQYGQPQSAPSEQQLASAPEPPPPLPQYSQPACPGPDYIWTPGYWSYSTAGYYWVPGVWVMAPYVGALWTPPYWGYSDGRYLWHAGYWGPHIGFYGGINYGFGYTGFGYYGGYWNNGAFVYNRAVNNVSVNVVHNVYNRSVVNYTSANRVSYNGGPRGVERRASAAELAVTRESRVAPVAAQVEHARQAASNRGQFAHENQGRPAAAAVERPLETPYRAPAAAPRDWRAQAAPEAARPERQEARPVEVRPEAPRPNEARPEAPRPNEADLRMVAAPQPALRARPEPVATPRVESRPNPIEPRPAQQAHPEPRVAPAHPHPAANPPHEDRRGGR